MPLVFYTGERRWDALAPLAELVEGGEEFADVLPAVQPLFLSLPALPAAELEASGGFFGWVLELIQRRKAPPEEFRALVGRIVGHLEGMPAEERERWLLLLSYIQALIYHDRPGVEREELREVIVNSVSSDPRRREVDAMTRTIADELREEGEVRSQQRILLRQLRLRFGRLPRAVEQVIRSTADADRLDAWLDGVVKAKSLDEVGIRVG